MRLFTTLTSAAVILAAGAFADMPSKNQKSMNDPCACLEQGMGLPSDKKCFPAAYNAPAAVSVQCGWDFDIFASFIYWHASQDNMDIAYQIAGTSTLPGQVFYQDFTYKPGFKVGVGFDTNYDDWTGFAEYTWFHQKTSSTEAAPSGRWSGSIWWWDSGPDEGHPAGSSIASSWKMHLDLLDVDFSRPYYQGTQLTVAPYAGLRALWIRQYLDMVNTIVASPTVDIIAKSQCWSIGPNAGVMGHWLVGMGFRFEGKTAGSLLYTRYTNVSVKNTDAAAVYLSKTTDYNCLRPTLEMGLGLGWGSYLSCKQYYIDFSARYDFNYLWDQNVMRNFVSQLGAYGDQIGDLMIHGLTVSGRFDF